MTDIDLNNPLHKLIVSKILLDADYSENIEDFNILLPNMFNVCITESGSIFLEFLIPVRMGIEKILNETGKPLISHVIGDNLYQGFYGYYINLSPYIYYEYCNSFSYMRKIDFVDRDDAYALNNFRGIKFFIYKLIRFDMNPTYDMFNHILCKLRDSVSDFNMMHDSVYNSISYRLNRAAKENVSIQRDIRMRATSYYPFEYDYSRFVIG